jgi:sulfate adenylyltransferase large subunit
MCGLLRICTAGSVDDGKSTLIGRLLYDARAVYEDQLLSVERASRRWSGGPIDFSLLTDGLKAEREQAITIDVAYRYFATAARKFILADTPGHEQYTRNMATGASTADLAILLVDARHGLRPQSHRHARIARLLGIRHFVVAVNKMDLVGFDRTIFDTIAGQFGELLAGAHVLSIPISALHGDNVATPSARTPWFGGPNLLEHLQTVVVDDVNTAARPFRMPVQLVLRSDEGDRVYAGQIQSGTVRRGDTLVVAPSGRRVRVARIVTLDGDLEQAVAPMSITVGVEGDLDIGRGAVLSETGGHASRRFEAELIWMDERPLDPRRVYLLKHGATTVTAEIDTPLELNAIGSVTVRTARALSLDRYDDNRTMGAFIVIDPATRFTAGAGMVSNAVTDRAGSRETAGVVAHIVSLARGAASEAEASDAVRRAIEEWLT